MKCFRCNAQAPHATLYRVNAKGRPGIWACFDHQVEKNSELEAIVAELEKQQEKKHDHTD